MGVGVIVIYLFCFFCFVGYLWVYVDYCLNHKAVNFRKILDP